MSYRMDSYEPATLQEEPEIEAELREIRSKLRSKYRKSILQFRLAGFDAFELLMYLQRQAVLEPDYGDVEKLTFWVREMCRQAALQGLRLKQNSFG